MRKNITFVPLLETVTLVPELGGFYLNVATKKLL